MTNLNRDLPALAAAIKLWGQELGFEHIGIAQLDLTEHEPRLQAWLDANYHGQMGWMERYGMLRARPAELQLGAMRVISARMNYLPPNAQFAKNLKQPELAYISRYALGRDYHKVLRQRLKKLGEKIVNAVSTANYRPFVDSAPILERPLAQNAGLGWIGKHSLLLDEEVGSWFFIGELLIDLPLPVDLAKENQCGRCVACKTSCPTGAIVEDFVVDARRCISYLTIEHDGAIPVELRRAIGNRIYGCDDCQLICPFNRAAPLTCEKDFATRPALLQAPLLTLLNWDEEMFLAQTEGSPIRRIGFFKWQRNIIVALGNAPFSEESITQLSKKLGQSALLDEHITWAIEELKTKSVSNEHNNAQQRLIRCIEKGLPRDA
ncbi:MAG: tRNA epoxyqueuosine(34) reductase QueG [Vibrionaceae bacterium]